MTDVAIRWSDAQRKPGPVDALWRALLDIDPRATPFHDIDLTRALAQVFIPERPMLQGEAVTADGRPLAHLLLSRRTRRIGPIRLRQLDAAAGYHASIVDMVQDPAFPDAAPALLGALQQSPGWDVLECRSVPRDGALARAAAAVGAVVTPEASAHAIELGAHDAITSGHRRRGLLRLRRRLEESAGITLEILSVGHPRWLLMLRDFANLHRARWHGTATPSPFESEAVRTRFVDWLSRPLARFPAIAAALVAKHEVAGAVIAFDDGRRGHAWRIAYRQDMRHFSPGIQLLTALATQMATVGRESLELGRGDDPYKQTWRTVPRHRVTVRWLHPTWRTRLVDRIGRAAGRAWLEAWRQGTP